MKWKVDGNAVISHSYQEELILSTFEELTGKRINWKPRKYKNIITLRSKGHIKIYDEHFIKGEAYKHKTGCYMCSHVAEDGTALLSKLGPNMIVKSAKHPITDLWECL